MTKAVTSHPLHQGGTLIFLYVGLVAHFFLEGGGGVRIFNFNNILGGFLKKIVFLVMKILWIFVWGHHKTGLFLVVISMDFKVIVVVVQNRNIFWELLNFQIVFRYV